MKSSWKCNLVFFFPFQTGQENFVDEIGIEVVTTEVPFLESSERSIDFAKFLLLNPLFC